MSASTGFRKLTGLGGTLLPGLAFLSFGAALLLYPAQVQVSVAQSVLYCLSSLVPSLFPFMVLASLGARSRAGDALGWLAGPLARWVFRVPKTCGAVLLLSFLGGYPAGARGVSLLWEEGKITREQAGRLMQFCVAPGAAFVVTFLGCGVLGSLRLGWLLFGAVTLSGLVLGILSGLGKPLPQESVIRDKSRESDSPLVRSVGDACSATAKMCGCILLFAGVIAILQGSGIFQTVASLAASTGVLTPQEASVCLWFLLEVTGGTGAAAGIGASPVFYAFGLAFGGLCVHLQVFSFFPDFPLNKGRFLLFRLLHGLLAAAIFVFLQRLFPEPGQLVWASSAEPLTLGTTAATAAGGLSLLLMSLAFLFFLGKDQKL